MTQLRDCKGGDKGDYRLVGLRGDDEEPVDLTAATAVAVTVQRQRVVVALTATVDDAAGGVLRVELGTATQDWLPSRPDPGLWDIEYEVTYNDGSSLTYPGEGRDTIKVWYDLNAPEPTP